MSVLEQDIETIFEALYGNTVVGNSPAIAAFCGVPPTRFSRALTHVRSPQWIEEHGWTIPNVQKGSGQKVWSVAARREDEGALRRGIKIKTPETIEHLRRAKAQADLASSVLDGRTAEGKWWKFYACSLDAMVSTAEMLEVVPERPALKIAA